MPFWKQLFFAEPAAAMLAAAVHLLCWRRGHTRFPGPQEAKPAVTN
jgi:hypothetical protein